MINDLTDTILYGSRDDIYDNNTHKATCDSNCM